MPQSSSERKEFLVDLAERQANAENIRQLTRAQAHGLVQEYNAIEAFQASVVKTKRTGHAKVRTLDRDNLEFLLDAYDRAHRSANEARMWM